MDRLRGKWVVLIGSEAELVGPDESWIEAQAQALLAAGPAGLVIVANKGDMTMAFLKAVTPSPPATRLPVVAVDFSRAGLPPAMSRRVTTWVDYDGGAMRPGDSVGAQVVLDGHAVAVARMRGSPGILALTREDDRRERLCRQMAIDWSIMVVVQKSPALPVAMPFQPWAASPRAPRAATSPARPTSRGRRMRSASTCGPAGGARARV